ncbi:MAG: PIN domain-containing protein [Phycisphaerae bacterium]
MAEPPPVVFFDACVLYPAMLRRLLMYMAVDHLFLARWSNAVHEEWMRAVLNNRPDITRRQVERIRDLMNENATDSLVFGFENRISNLTLSDPSDRHVLAAAFQCRASMIVTFNLKHFPVFALKQYDIEARSPDDFICFLVEMVPDMVCRAARRHRLSLKSPPMTVEASLHNLEISGIVKTVKALRDLFASL